MQRMPRQSAKRLAGRTCDLYPSRTPNSKRCWVCTARTAQANQIRGFLTEFGLVMPVGIRSIKSKVPEMLEDAENGLSVVSRALIARLFEHFRTLDRQVDELEREINAWHREDT